VLKRTGLAIASGLALSLAFEPVAFAYLMPVAVAGFAISTRGLPVRRGLIPGLAFGVAFYFVHIYWMRESIGLAAWLALASLEALFYALLGSASAALQRLRWWPAWLAAAWVTMEIWRSGWPFSGMPWGRLAFGAVDTPAAYALPYVGMNGLSFLLALLAFVLARVVVERDRSDRLVAGGVLVAVCVATALPALVPYRLAEPAESTVAVVQGNVPGRGDDVLVDPRGITDNHIAATLALADDVRAGVRARPDFVLWPENSTALDPFEDRSINQGITAAAIAIDAPVLVGAMVSGGERNVLNQGVVWDPETGAGERYTKWHPVAYGEYIPFRSMLSEIGLTDTGQLARIPRDMLSGTREQPLTIAGVELADGICFDVAYDDGFYAQIQNGAELLSVQTSNASFIFTDQIEQQFAITRLRAMEAGKYLAVASTNGRTGVISPDGEVVATARPRTQSVLVETVGLRHGVTPGVRVGGWLGILLPLATAAGLLLRVLTYRRQRRQAAAAAAPAEPALVGGPDEKVPQ
jgi:apolipoprotein N-acyltransferase